MCEIILAQNCQKFDNFNLEFSMSHHNAHYQSYKNAPRGCYCEPHRCVRCSTLADSSALTEALLHHCSTSRISLSHLPNNWSLMHRKSGTCRLPGRCRMRTRSEESVPLENRRPAWPLQQQLGSYQSHTSELAHLLLGICRDISNVDSQSFPRPCSENWSNIMPNQFWVFNRIQCKRQSKTVLKYFLSSRQDLLRLTGTGTGRNKALLITGLGVLQRKLLSNGDSLMWSVLTSCAQKKNKKCCN